MNDESQNSAVFSHYQLRGFDAWGTMLATVTSKFDEMSGGSVV